MSRKQNVEFKLKLSGLTTDIISGADGPIIVLGLNLKNKWITTQKVADVGAEKHRWSLV